MSNPSDFVIENGVLKKYVGPGGDVVVPEGVTAIGGDSFIGPFYESRGTLTSVTLPKSVTSICNNAFEDCVNLSRIIIPESVTDIGTCAFFGCEGLADAQGFVIVNGVLSGYYGTADDVVVPDGVRIVDGDDFHGGYGTYGIFGNCKAKRIILPDSVTEIRENVFYGCAAEELKLPAAAVSDKMFGKSGKTILLTVTRPDKAPVRAVASFRKEYWSQKWTYPKDFLLPLSEEAVAVYDKLVAGGSYDGFTMNENGRIRAALLRLTDTEFPVSAELRGQFADLLASKLNKAIKFAEEDAASNYIQAMLDVGAINAENRAKVGKALAKSSLPEIRAFAAAATSASATTAALAEKGPELPFSKQLKKLKAPALLLKYSIDSLPEVLLADGSGPAPSEYLQYILAEYITQAKKKEAELISSADEAAQMLDRKSLQTALRTVYDNIQNEKQQLAVLMPLFRYADGATVRELYPRNHNTRWKEESANVALLVSETREAMLYADKYKLLGDYAELRSTSADFLRDTVLAEFGLDETGKKVYDLGAGTVTVSLGHDLDLTLFDDKAGKPVKSIPKRNADPEKYASAKADFDELRKNVKTAAKNRANQLLQSFLYAESFKAEEWKPVYLKNPVLNRVARLLVWVQGEVTFTLDESGAVNSAGQPYCITEKPIQLAHPMEMVPGELTTWQKYISAHGLKQPFLQVWEPVYTADEIKQDRYSGCKIPYYRFLGQEKHGIFVRDYDFHNDIEITLSGCSAIVDRLDWQRHEIDMNDCFEVRQFGFQSFTRRVNHIVAYLDRVTVWDRVRKDDLSVMDMMPKFTLAQITEFILAAQEANATNVLAELLNYKNANFADFDPMDEFTLEL